MTARFCVLFVTGIVYFASAQVAHADSRFSVAYDVHYDVDAAGKTRVIQNIALTNLTNRFFASDYRISVRNKRLENVTAHDAGGDLDTQVVEKDGGYEIHVAFNEKIVGTGKVLSWVLSYELPDAATQHGAIWEINIPGILQQEQISAYTVTLSVPKQFGQHSFLSPQPASLQTTQSHLRYTFDQASVIKSGVSAIFGTHQKYSFHLTYHLANPNLVPAVSEIALPPDTNYQAVFISDIVPRPKDVRVDEDGNYLAQFDLARGQKLDIVASGIIDIRQRNVPIVPISESQRGRYLEPQAYWEATNPLIIEKAKELKTPRAIYQFVTQYLSYDQERLNSTKIERLGALAALSNPNKAVCMEFTDLFIALARAAGIPAREANGYAYTFDNTFRPLSLKNNADILHAWPEYWDDTAGWVPVDPTWGSTTKGVNYFDQFDFNHITFAIHGFSSTQPYPAGAYKYRQDQGKDVVIAFSDQEIIPQSTLELNLAVPTSLLAGLENRGRVFIRNRGNSATNAGTLALTTNTTEVIGPQSLLIGTLPAFANREVEFLLRSAGFFTHKTDIVGVQLGPLSEQVAVRIQPLPFFQIIPWVGGIIGGTGIVIIGYIVVAHFRRLRIADKTGGAKKQPPESFPPRSNTVKTGRIPI